MALRIGYGGFHGRCLLSLDWRAVRKGSVAGLVVFAVDCGKLGGRGNSAVGPARSCTPNN